MAASFHPVRSSSRFLICCALGLVLAAASGCWHAQQAEVVVYSALDEEFARPLLDDFAADEHLAVLGKYDSESTKTVGLVAAIVAERERPRCDVFWNNEVLHTIRLADLGLLEEYAYSQTEQIAPEFRSAKGEWYGFAGRARVLLVNTEQLQGRSSPQSILDLTNSVWKGRVGIAKPLFGTTATHAACLFAAWGDERARGFWKDVRDSVQVMSGNKQVAEAVGSGQLVFGLTDTDDALAEVLKGSPVKIVFPDQGEDQCGALLLPNTLAVIRGAPHPQAAHRLIERLLSAESERRLASGLSGQLPLRRDLREQSWRPEFGGRAIKTMQVDFHLAAKKWPEVVEFLHQTFAAGEK